MDDDDDAPMVDPADMLWRMCALDAQLEADLRGVLGGLSEALASESDPERCRDLVRAAFKQPRERYESGLRLLRETGHG